MNRFKPKVEPTEEPKKEKKAQKSFLTQLGSYLSAYIDRRYLGKNFEANIRFMVFVAFIGVLYIANALSAERRIRQINKTSNQVKEFQIEYITLQSQLMFKSRPTGVAEMLKLEGIEQSKSQPHIIIKQ
jgi:cell division protein FtsN